MLRHLPERQGLEYAAKRPKGLDFALSLFASTLDTSDANQIFDEVVHSRGLVLDEMADRRHVAADAARPELAPLWTALVSARQRFANLVISGSSGLRGDQLRDFSGSGASRKRGGRTRSFGEERNVQRQSLAARGWTRCDTCRSAWRLCSCGVRPVNRTLLGRPGVGAGSKTTFTPPSTIRKPVPSYMAFVIRGGNTPLSVVSLRSATVIDGLVVRWHEELTEAGRGIPADREPAYRAAGMALRQRIWDPLRKHLTGMARRCWSCQTGRSTWSRSLRFPSEKRDTWWTGHPPFTISQLNGTWFHPSGNRRPQPACWRLVARRSTIARSSRRPRHDRHQARSERRRRRPRQMRELRLELRRPAFDAVRAARRDDERGARNSASLERSAGATARESSCDRARIQTGSAGKPCPSSGDTRLPPRKHVLAGRGRDDPLRWRAHDDGEEAGCHYRDDREPADAFRSCARRREPTRRGGARRRRWNLDRRGDGGLDLMGSNGRSCPPATRVWGRGGP